MRELVYHQILTPLETTVQITCGENCEIPIRVPISYLNIVERGRVIDTAYKILLVKVYIQSMRINDLNQLYILIQNKERNIDTLVFEPSDRVFIPPVTGYPQTYETYPSSEGWKEVSIRNSWIRSIIFKAFVKRPVGNGLASKIADDIDTDLIRIANDERKDMVYVFYPFGDGSIMYHSRIINKLPTWKELNY